MTGLLGHQYTKIFICHGSKSGHLEATYRGAPIPTFLHHAENVRNGARVQARGHGKLLKWDETNANEI